MNVTDHAVERYLERVDSKVTIDVARRIIGTAVKSQVRSLIANGGIIMSRMRLSCDGVTYVVAVNEQGPAVLTCYRDQIVKARRKNDVFSARSRRYCRKMTSKKGRPMRPKRANDWC